MTTLARIKDVGCVQVPAKDDPVQLLRSDNCDINGILHANLILRIRHVYAAISPMLCLHLVVRVVGFPWSHFPPSFGCVLVAVKFDNKPPKWVLWGSHFPTSGQSAFDTSFCIIDGESILARMAENTD